MSSCQLLVCNHRDTSNHKNQECCDSCVHRNEPLSYTRLYLRDKKINKSVLQIWKTDSPVKQLIEATLGYLTAGQSVRQPSNLPIMYNRIIVSVSVRPV